MSVNKSLIITAAGRGAAGCFCLFVKLFIVLHSGTGDVDIDAQPPSYTDPALRTTSFSVSHSVAGKSRFVRGCCGCFVVVFIPRNKIKGGQGKGGKGGGGGAGLIIIRITAVSMCSSFLVPGLCREDVRV